MYCIHEGGRKLHIHCIMRYFIQGAESKYNSWTRMCGLIMVQWRKIKLEADTFLKEFEIKIILKEMLIKEKTCNKGRMVCIYGHKGHAFLPTCSLLHLFPAHEATNTVTVSGFLKPWVQIFLSCQGYISHFQWRFIRRLWQWAVMKPDFLILHLWCLICVQIG